MSSPERFLEDEGATESSSNFEPEGDEVSLTSNSPISVSDVVSGTTASSIASVELYTEEDNANVSSLSDEDTFAKIRFIDKDLLRKLIDKVEKNFEEVMLDDDKLEEGLERYLERIYAFITLGLTFQAYREIRMGAYTATVIRLQQLSTEKNQSTNDIFAEYYDKERKCVCIKCTKLVLATGFSMHLEVCMGVKEARTRNPRRGATATSSRDHNDSHWDSLQSSEGDDDDDADWSCEREKRKKKRDRNGSKKMKGKSATSKGKKAHQNKNT